MPLQMLVSGSSVAEVETTLSNEPSIVCDWLVGNNLSLSKENRISLVWKSEDGQETCDF